MLDGTGDSITGSLETFSLDTCPPFYALSYEWGTDVDVHPISVDGNFLSLRSNLISFLESYMTVIEYLDDIWDVPDYEFSPGDYMLNDCGHIWIDQICIDQNSTMEKNHQVGLMSQIYTKAEAVIVWLGPGLEQCLEWPQTEGYDEWCTTVEHDAQVCADNKEEFSVGTPAALEQILDASYWTRLWVQQEVLLARHVILASGKTFVPATLLHRAVELVNEFRMVEPVLVIAAWSSGPYSYSLLEAVDHFSEKICLNPRDKVYGLLGMLDEDIRKRIIVDYNRPVIDVFREVTQLMRGIDLEKGVDLEKGFELDHRVPWFLGLAMGLCVHDIKRIVPKR